MAKNRLSTILTLLLAFGLVVSFWLRGERFIAANGPTFDEGVHLAAGYAYWARGDFRVNAEDPPLLKLLWALPAVMQGAPPLQTDGSANHWHIANAWLQSTGVSPQTCLAPARRMNLALGCGLVLLVGWCGYRVCGSRLAGLASCGFAASDPTLVALSCILSTDLGLTLFALLTCYLAWEYVAAPSRLLLVATGISLGLMLASKFSAIGIVAGLGAAGLIYLLRGRPLALPGHALDRGLRSFLELTFRLAAIAIATVAATYGVIHFSEWGHGLKFQLTRGSHGDGVMYLFGEISRQGWYHYFLVALALKLPLGLLIAALVSEFVRPPAVEMSLRSLWLVLPPIVFFALASYSRVDLGVRVVLPALPFLYLLAGGLAGAETCCWRRFLVLGCVGWCFWSAVLASPHELSYTNALARLGWGDRLPLADSNLDWGQGLPALKKWMDEEGVDHIYLAYFGTDRPEAYGIRYQQLPAYGHLDAARSLPVPLDAKRQIVAISTNHLLGLFLPDPQLYAWLRQHPPLTVLDGSICVYDISNDPEAIDRVRVAK